MMKNNSSRHVREEEKLVPEDFFYCCSVSAGFPTLLSNCFLIPCFLPFPRHPHSPQATYPTLVPLTLLLCILTHREKIKETIRIDSNHSGKSHEWTTPFQMLPWQTPSYQPDSSSNATFSESFPYSRGKAIPTVLFHFLKPLRDPSSHTTSRENVYTLKNPREEAVWSNSVPHPLYTLPVPAKGAYTASAWMHVCPRYVASVMSDSSQL